MRPRSYTVVSLDDRRKWQEMDPKEALLLNGRGHEQRLFQFPV